MDLIKEEGKGVNKDGGVLPLESIDVDKQETVEKVENKKQPKEEATTDKRGDGRGVIIASITEKNDAQFQSTLDKEQNVANLNDGGGPTSNTDGASEGYESIGGANNPDEEEVTPSEDGMRQVWIGLILVALLAIIVFAVIFGSPQDIISIEPLRNTGPTVVASLSGASPELQVITCDANSVTVYGTFAQNNLTAGMAFFYTDTNIQFCAPCHPIFRKIESISQGNNEFTKILNTSFVTMGEVFGESLKDANTAEDLLEPSLNCSHSGGDTGRILLESEIEESNPLQKRNLLTARPRNCEAWYRKNSDGRCSYTNCYVGKEGDPNNCFSCFQECDNGCGSKSFDVPDDFGAFNFGEACCKHDLCYSSTFGKVQCDLDFLDDMMDACGSSSFLSSSFLHLWKLPLRFTSDRVGCNVVALLYYVAVAAGGYGSFNQAQREQRAHESEPLCVAECPSFQRSGGQGTTTLSIDVGATDGVFPFFYEMYTIPDQVYIEIDVDGTKERIFDTLGLVSGSLSRDISISGSTSIVQVTIHAPNAGTKWDVDVGCILPTNPPTCSSEGAGIPFLPFDADKLALAKKAATYARRVYKGEVNMPGNIYSTGWDRMATYIEGDYCWLTWAGTDDLGDVLQDLNAQSFTINGDCNVHKGFFRNYAGAGSGFLEFGQFHAQFLPQIDDFILNDCGCRNLIFVGHSLGGASAMIGAMLWHERNPTVITFGQPAVSHNSNCDKYLNKDNIWRFVNTEKGKEGLNPFDNDIVYDVVTKLNIAGDHKGGFIILPPGNETGSVEPDQNNIAYFGKRDETMDYIGLDDVQYGGSAHDKYHYEGKIHRLEDPVGVNVNNGHY